jgi:hypothetical protein
LLYFLNNEETLKQNLKNYKSYIFLLLDLQERNGEMSLTSFFQFIFKMLSEKLGSSFVPDSAMDDAKDEAKCYEIFKSIVSNTDKHGLKLIISFDEFGTITGSGQFDPDFFSFLRSIANNHECAYITTSRQKLQKLCRDSNVSESPFFNIFTPIPLGQFDREEALSLIFTPSANAGIKFFSEDAEFILSLSGHHPLFIQMACAALFDYKAHNQDRSAKADYEEVKACFLTEATEQFEQIWQDEEDIEREVLSLIAIGEEIKTQQQYIVHELRRKGYLINEPPMLFSQAFSDFVLSKNPSIIVPEQSVKPIKNQSSFSSFVDKIFKRS